PFLGGTYRQSAFHLGGAGTGDTGGQFVAHLRVRGLLLDGGGHLLGLGEFGLQGLEFRGVLRTRGFGLVGGRRVTFGFGLGGTDLPAECAQALRRFVAFAFTLAATGGELFDGLREFGAVTFGCFQFL